MTLIELGKIVKPHGYTGAFLATAVAGDQSALGQIEELHIGFKRDQVTLFPIVEAAWMPKGWKIQVQGIETDAQVKALVGATLFAERANLPPLEPGEHYVEDLVGAEVRDQSSGQVIGSFRGVQSGESGSPDIWWIERPTGELGVPAVKRYIASVLGTPPVITLCHLDELEPVE